MTETQEGKKRLGFQVIYHSTSRFPIMHTLRKVSRSLSYIAHLLFLFSLFIHSFIRPFFVMSLPAGGGKREIPHSTNESSSSFSPTVPPSRIQVRANLVPVLIHIFILAATPTLLIISLTLFSQWQHICLGILLLCC